MAKRVGFTSVEQDEESLLKIKEARMKRARIIGVILCVIALVVAGVLIWSELRTYHSYEVVKSVEAASNASKKYELFLNKTIEYSNDGILYRDREWNRLWNQSFEMESPQVDICEGYLTIYDKGGSEIYIMDKDGLVQKLNMSKPVYSVRVASQGTVAVLMKENKTAYVRLYDTDGKELTNGEFYEKQGSYPVGIDISNDGKKLALNSIEVHEGEMSTVIHFYNFGSVGQNEVNYEVSNFSFKEKLFPDISFVNNDKLLAIGDSSFAVFEGTQKPELLGEYEYGQEVQSLCHNDKYICIMYSNNDDDNSFHLRVFDLKGKKVMDQDTKMAYSVVEFLENNEICVRNKLECQIFTIRGIKKFQYTFDKELYKVLSGADKQSYSFAIEKTIEEVRLK